MEFSGYRVVRGMAVTDLEDKAIQEAAKQAIPLRLLTERNLGIFLREMNQLRMKSPEYMPWASECVPESVSIIETLLGKKRAYRHGRNIYFDPLTFPGFGRLYGLDMSAWPVRKRRFHKDTYPGMRWNKGDFILWHGRVPDEDSPWWESSLGQGWPSWNVQDPSMIVKYFPESLSVFCGGIDNLVRHHDYSRAILESVRPGPMARVWLHCRHLLVNGKKMSKSMGNILYTDDLIARGYSIDEIRFFLIGTHYRRGVNYSDTHMQDAALRFRKMKKRIESLTARGSAAGASDPGACRHVIDLFTACMDNDLNTGETCGSLIRFLDGLEIESLPAERARGMCEGLKEIDTVLQVLFSRS